MKKNYLFKVLALAIVFALPEVLFAQASKAEQSLVETAVKTTQHDVRIQKSYSGEAANVKSKAPGDVINYGIKFGETGSEKMITSGNYTDISAANGFDAIESGTVTFDPETYTLTLKDAVITAPLRYDKEKSDIDVAEFILNLEGSNQITSRGASIALAYSDATIKGSGSLKCNSEKDCGIYVLGNHNFKISCTGLIDAEGRWGISGPIDREGYLRFVNANVKAKGSDASICDLAKIELSGCEIVSPIGAYIENGAVKLDGSDCKEEVVIKPIVNVNYGITFGETGSEKMITSGNYTDISAANGFDAIESGTVTFDPETYTLTLKDAVITAPLRYDKEKSDIDVAEFILNLEGSNQITSRGASIALAYSDATIKGSGSLKCNSEKDCGIYVLGNHNFKISCTGLIDAEGRWGISGPIDREGYLRFVNANVKAKGSDASICDLAKIELSGCEIVSPIGAYIENGAVKLDGSDCKEEVVIKPIVNYGIRFGENWSEKMITSGNYTDISAANGFDAIESGTVTFDPETYTLTLKDAVITAPLRYDKEKSDIDVAEFILNLEGSNQITSRGASIALAYSDATIKGSGSLKCNSEKDCGIYVLGNHNFKISCTGLIDAEGRWGISGPIDREGYLRFVNANVKAKGSDASICDLAKIELSGCEIVSPIGAYIENGTVKLDGSDCKEEVVISNDPNSIDSIEADSQTKQGIYTISGVRLNADFESLPQGIYIVNGKKVQK